MARKKKQSASIYLVKIFFWLFITCIAVYYAVDFFITPADVFYPGFQITIPPGYAIHGIDVSHYQRTVNWKEVKQMTDGDAKIGFAFIKATEGVGNVDDQFRRNWLKAEEQDICKGAYHFFVAGKSGKKQAGNFIEIVNLKKGDLPPVLDIEQAYGISSIELKKEVAEWLLTIEKQYGIKPVIYTNIDFYKNYLQKDFEDYPIWIAHYLQPEKPRIERKWSFWQHNESGRVNGIKTPVDFNVFSGDSLDFRNFLIQ
ncbi:MAG: GH25 family lysozyme [Ginsengibacter sp.]